MIFSKFYKLLEYQNYFKRNSGDRFKYYNLCCIRKKPMKVIDIKDKLLLFTVFTTLLLTVLHPINSLILNQRIVAAFTPSSKY